MKDPVGKFLDFLMICGLVVIFVFTVGAFISITMAAMVYFWTGMPLDHFVHGLMQ